MLTGFDLCRAAMAVVEITPPAQSVLNVLAIMANEDAQCWPPIGGPTGLTAKTKLSERAVQMATKALEAAGHITRHVRPGRGIVYSVHPQDASTPAGDAPPARHAPPAGGAGGARGAPTPAGGAPKQPITASKKKKTTSSPSRARTRVPEGFEPIATGKAAEIVATWPPGRQASELEAFTAHHASKGTLSADWQASWRTWVHRSAQFTRQPAGRAHGGAPRFRDPMLQRDFEAGRLNLDD